MRANNSIYTSSLVPSPVKINILTSVAQGRTKPFRYSVSGESEW